MLLPKIVNLPQFSTHTLKDHIFRGLLGAILENKSLIKLLLMVSEIIDTRRIHKLIIYFLL